MGRWKLIVLGAIEVLGLLAAGRTLAAQGVLRLRGVVRSAGDSLPVAEALVRVLGGGRTGVTFTSPTGQFELAVDSGLVRLVAVRIGFAPETLVVEAGRTDIAIWLRESAITLAPITVASEPALSAASSRLVRELDIHLRPRETAQELLRLAPGLVIAQHAGGGKAEQIFLRGFDADHGTDVAIAVDGVPVNMVSHAHGQGYADLHFVMPEVVARGEVHKGPFDAADGDFATAGSVSFFTYDRLPHRTVAVRGGSFRTLHASLLAPFGGDATRAGGYVALSGHRSDGPFQAPQDYLRFNGFTKVTAPVGPATQLVASASGFHSTWDASGQIPERAVRSGLIDRYGAIDPSEGGRTARYDLQLGLRSTAGGPRNWDAGAFLTKYDFRLFSNFTFFLADTVNGDGIEQRDDRLAAGLLGRFTAPAPGGRVQVGGGLRADFTDVALDHQVRRAVLNSLVDARVRQYHGFGWVKHEVSLSPAVRLELGMRGDLFRFQVTDRLESRACPLPHRSGARTSARVSPKLNLAAEVSRRLTLFGNAGFGFHSNDARAAVNAPAGARVVPRAFGVELGGRYTWTGGSAALSLWGLDLQSELIWVGDEGTTEASGRTRRIGLDVEGRLQLAPWLWADLDLDLSHGRLRDEPAGQNRIPLAPTIASAGGLTARELGPVTGGIRYRYVGARPANEDNSVRARGYFLTEVFASWSVRRARLVVAVDNLFDVTWNEAQFATTSRLPGEPPEGVTELHFTPGAGRALQVGVEYAW
jgi:hypothetical protein